MNFNSKFVKNQNKEKKQKKKTLNPLALLRYAIYYRYKYVLLSSLIGPKSFNPFNQYFWGYQLGRGSIFIQSYNIMNTIYIALYYKS